MTVSTSASRIRAAYGARSAEYTELLGSIEAMHELDRARIAGWAGTVDGRILDAGCGPGHWAAFLRAGGHDVEGVDLVPEFIAGARRRFPEVPFRIGSLQRIDTAAGSLGGVLAWYSLIHTAPEELPAILREIRRALVPGGGLLAGFFRGTAGKPFAHAITAGYYWSVESMGELLDAAGFEVRDAETRQDPGTRPLASISAIARRA